MQIIATNWRERKKKKNSADSYLNFSIELRIGTGALSPGVKRPGGEADHSSSTTADVKKMWIYTSTPIRLHVVVLN
jgi:hypothetical protein